MWERDWVAPWLEPWVDSRVDGTEWLTVVYKRGSSVGESCGARGWVRA